MQLTSLRFFFTIVLLQASLWALSPAEQVENNSSNDDRVAQELLVNTSIAENQRLLREKRLSTIAQVQGELDEITRQLTNDNVWEKSYSSHVAYAQVRSDLAALQAKIETLNSNRKKSADDLEVLDDLESKEKILSEQFKLLGTQQGTNLFSTLLQPEEIDEIPVLSNPLDIFTAISFIKHLEEIYADYTKRGSELTEMISLLKKKKEILNNLTAINEKGGYESELYDINRRLDKFINAQEILKITANIYDKRIDEIEVKLNKEVQIQVYKLGKIGLIILFLFTLAFFSKVMSKKYITDNDRFYMANKIINFSNYILIMIILLFNYIENVSYLVTVLGFASAGIAIAMKDWFMSMLGWLVIVLGGSIHVGDRIRVDMDGMRYVGDVMDISLLRMTILEDITLTTYYENRRAGRIIFIPNNYVFTRMKARYSHDSLKTVRDGIDVAISFDSNHKKAMHLSKEVARKYSKGYTDITRKQLNKLRHKYSLKNTNVEPKVFSFIEPYGLNISVWYLTNAYATLTLRSTISSEIIDAYNAEDDITIAYPTQQLNLTMNRSKLPQQPESGEVPS
ncbi:MAG: mechanosensitive ion channel [Helicobacteraceae bacterium]|jgi:small-conductance mechanosensitive channel|nr:mechanosensitive ion channel [Helicobacteraceae bacterium]